MKKLKADFFERENVVQIAKELIGKILVTKFDGILTSGRIVETEAYVGLTDKASHSFAGKRTARNEDMYAKAGTSYVYICYGMHQMFNIVTNKINVPDAVLVRAVEPLQGLETMLERTGKARAGFDLTKGPGNVGKALGIWKRHSGIPLSGNQVFIASDKISDEWSTRLEMVGVSKRIGVESSGPAALLPYRFYVKGNKYVSSYPNK